MYVRNINSMGCSFNYWYIKIETFKIEFFQILNDENECLNIVPMRNKIR